MSEVFWCNRMGYHLTYPAGILECQLLPHAPAWIPTPNEEGIGTAGTEMEEHLRGPAAVVGPRVLPVQVQTVKPILAHECDGRLHEGRAGGYAASLGDEGRARKEHDRGGSKGGARCTTSP